jgi:hypothetical protein
MMLFSSRDHFTPPRSETMQNWAVIEISLSADGRTPIQLLRCSYRASQAGLVALVLNGVEARAADRALDPLVARLPLTIPGVAYLSIEDDARVQDAVLSADTIFVATARFRDAVLSLGVERDLIRPAHLLLTRLGQETLFRSAGLSATGAWLSRPQPLPVHQGGTLSEVSRA